MKSVDIEGIIIAAYRRMCGCGEAKTENTKGAASNNQWEIMALKKTV